MPDDYLRALERRYAQTGWSVDRERWLHTARRAGIGLAEYERAVAFFSGSDDANGQLPFSAAPASFNDWLGRLLTFPRAFQLRATVAALRAILRGQHVPSYGGRLIEAVERCLDSPSAEHLERLRTSVSLVDEELTPQDAIAIERFVYLADDASATDTEEVLSCEGTLHYSSNLVGEAEVRAAVEWEVSEWYQGRDARVPPPACAHEERTRSEGEEERSPWGRAHPIRRASPVI